jgi:hypothetical protein
MNIDTIHTWKWALRFLLTLHMRTLLSSNASMPRFIMLYTKLSAHRVMPFAILFLCTLFQMCRSNCGTHQVNGTLSPYPTWYFCWQWHHYYILDRHHQYTYLIFLFYRPDGYSNILELLNALQKYGLKLLFLAHKTIECSILYRQICHKVLVSPQLPPTGKDLLLAMYNCVWQENSVPATWSEAKVILILKPSRDHSHATSCRSHCLCMISHQLFWILGNRNLLSYGQCLIHSWSRGEAEVAYSKFFPHLTTACHVTVFFDSE